ncbi:hypothetical protein L195_g048024, partial [Trifolium pratense]
MKVERKNPLNQEAKFHVLLLKFFSMNKSEHYRSLQNGLKFLRNLNKRTASQHENEINTSDDDDDDGLPPLEANTNRMRPIELQ